MLEWRFTFKHIWKTCIPPRPGAEQTRSVCGGSVLMTHREKQSIEHHRPVLFPPQSSTAPGARGHEALAQRQAALGLAWKWPSHTTSPRDEPSWAKSNPGAEKQLCHLAPRFLLWTSQFREQHGFCQGCSMAADTHFASPFCRAATGFLAGEQLVIPQKWPIWR